MRPALAVAHDLSMLTHTFPVIARLRVIVRFAMIWCPPIPLVSFRFLLCLTKAVTSGNATRCACGAMTRRHTASGPCPCLKRE